MVFVVNDPVIHRKTGEKGSIIEVNSYYEWYKVRYMSGHVREYKSNMKNHEMAVKLDLS